jgi:hypothetical protein
MSDDQIRSFLQARGVADHVVDGGLEGLIGAWEQAATEIESGYAATLDEYLNDLDGRQLIERVLGAMPEPDGPLLDRLRAADARVHEAGRMVTQCLWGEENRAAHGWTQRRNWWYFLVPREPAGDLAADLERAGFGGSTPSGG